MKIYTKKGDGGDTDLFESKTLVKKRVSKSDPRLNVIGTLDEANGVLGIIKSQLGQNKQIILIEKIQEDIFTINSTIAGINKVFSKKRTLFLERQIDLMEKSLPKLTRFILPGGSTVSSFCHLARSVVRRGERALVDLENINSKNTVSSYINRLSDFLFVLARQINHSEKQKDRVWVKK